MTRIDFYILQQQDLGERLHFACRLTEKVFRQGRDIYIHASDEGSAQRFDQMLWEFSPASFVPHGLVGDEDEEPVTIGWGADPGRHSDVLINLDLNVPDFFGRFERVSEIVVQEPQCRDALRASYRYYKERGYPLENHQIGTSGN